MVDKVCVVCGELKKIKAKRMCGICYRKQYIPRPSVKRICVVCGENKIHQAFGMCAKCYGKKYRSEHKERVIEIRVAYSAKYKDLILKRSEDSRREKGELSYIDNKNCSVHLGVFVGEKIFSTLYPNAVHMPAGNPGYDFVCRNGAKIDIKTSTLHTGDRWGFNIDKNILADFFVCIAFDNRIDLNPLHIWMFPSNDVCAFSTITACANTLSKWDKYKMDINKVVKCYNNIRESNNG